MQNIFWIAVTIGILLWTSPAFSSGPNFNDTSQRPIIPDASGDVGIGTANPQAILSVAGHMNTSGSSPSLSGCGTGPSVVGNDYAFTITGGAFSTGCTATFATPYNKVPVCQVSQETLSLVNLLSYAVTTTSVTITQLGLGTNKLDIVCLGRD